MTDEEKKTVVQEVLNQIKTANIYACVSAKTADSFTVYTGDDETFNAGGFTFMVLGTWFWT